MSWGRSWLGGLEIKLTLSPLAFPKTACCAPCSAAAAAMALLYCLRPRYSAGQELLPLLVVALLIQHGTSAFGHEGADALGTLLHHFRGIASQPTWQHKFVLPEDALAKAETVHSDTTRLAAVARKLLLGHQVVITHLGNRKSEISADQAWIAIFHRWLELTFTKCGVLESSKQLRSPDPTYASTGASCPSSTIRLRQYPIPSTLSSPSPLFASQCIFPTLNQSDIDLMILDLPPPLASLAPSLTTASGRARSHSLLQQEGVRARGQQTPGLREQGSRGPAVGRKSGRSLQGGNLDPTPLASVPGAAAGAGTSPTLGHTRSLQDQGSGATPGADGPSGSEPYFDIKNPLFADDALALDTLLRQVLAMPSMPAIILLHSGAGDFGKDSGMGRGADGRGSGVPGEKRGGATGAGASGSGQAYMSGGAGVRGGTGGNVDASQQPELDLGAWRGMMARYHGRVQVLSLPNALAEMSALSAVAASSGQQPRQGHPQQQRVQQQQQQQQQRRLEQQQQQQHAGQPQQDAQQDAQQAGHQRVLESQGLPGGTGQAQEQEPSHKREQLRQHVLADILIHTLKQAARNAMGDLLLHAVLGPGAWSSPGLGFKAEGTLSAAGADLGFGAGFGSGSEHAAGATAPATAHDQTPNPDSSKPGALPEGFPESAALYAGLVGDNRPLPQALADYARAGPREALPLRIRKGGTSAPPASFRDTMQCT